VAVPVAAGDTCEEFRGEVDETVCAMTPEPFQAVGIWYRDFSPTSDTEVRDLLERARGGERTDRGDRSSSDLEAQTTAGGTSHDFKR